MNLCGGDINNMKPLVVDVNVIFSALISHGDSSKVFTKNVEEKTFSFIAPEYILIEVGKHTTEIAQRSNLPLDEAQRDLDFITKNIFLIPEMEYVDKINEAKEILKEHRKDVPYLALALKFNCGIFSGDKVFKELCPDRVKNPKEILEELNK